ncbi:MAG: NAD(P)/FAD-dependent oxidoreductase [Pseudomonadota bacterium]
MPACHRVVVVGAGFAGLSVVRGLARREDVGITLVDKQNHHLFQPLLYQVATAGLSPADISAPIRTIVKRNNTTRVLLDELLDIDREGRQLKLSSGAEVGYDTLVIATGARHSYFGNDQWAEHAPGIKTLDDAVSVRRRILLAMESAETLRQEFPAERSIPINFVVIGGGPTGVEMAGAIAELTRHAVEMDFRFISPDCLRIILVEGNERLLMPFPPALSDYAKRALEHLGVEIRLKSRVTDITENEVFIDGDPMPSAATIWAAGVQASPVARWLGVDGDRSGRVGVSADLSLDGDSDIFVIGDTAAVTNDNGKPVPGIAPAAKQQGKYVAKLLNARLDGNPPPPPFHYRHQGSLATIGRKRAVVDFGWTRAKGLIAWLFWSTAHVYFLVGFRNRIVVGMNWLWNYLTFERGARLITGLSAAPPRRPAKPAPSLPEKTTGPPQHDDPLKVAAE